MDISWCDNKYEQCELHDAGFLQGLSDALKEGSKELYNTRCLDLPPEHTLGALLEGWKDDPEWSMSPADDAGIDWKWWAKVQNLSLTADGDWITVGYKKGSDYMLARGESFGPLRSLQLILPPELRSRIWSSNTNLISCQLWQLQVLTDVTRHTAFAGDENQMVQELPIMCGITGSAKAAEQALHTIFSELGPRFDRWRDDSDFKSLKEMVPKRSIFQRVLSNSDPFELKTEWGYALMVKQVLARSPPTRDTKTTITEKLFQEGQKCYDLLKKWTEEKQEHPDHPDIRSKIALMLAAAREEVNELQKQVKKDQKDPKSPESGERIPRRVNTASWSKHNNVKGAFLSFVINEWSYIQLVRVHKYLTPTAAETPISFVDGGSLLAPFCLKPSRLAGAEKHVWDVSDGLLRPRLIQAEQIVGAEVFQNIVQNHQQLLEERKGMESSSRSDSTGSRYKSSEIDHGCYNQRKMLTCAMMHEDTRDKLYHPDGEKKTSNEPFWAATMRRTYASTLPPDEYDLLVSLIKEDIETTKPSDDVLTIEMITGQEPPADMCPTKMAHEVILHADEVMFYIRKKYLKIASGHMPTSKEMIQIKADGNYQLMSTEELRRHLSHIKCKVLKCAKHRPGEGECNGQTCIEVKPAVDVYLSTAGSLGLVHLHETLPSIGDSIPTRPQLLPPCQGPANAYSFNTWHGFAASHMPDTYHYMAMDIARLKEEKPVRFFEDLVNKLLREPVMCEYFLRWLAHMFQYPAQLPKTYGFLASEAHGVGKNVTTDLIACIVGPSLRWITDRSQTFKGEGFTEGRGSILVVADEVKDLAVVESNLNAMVTSQTLTVRQLYTAPESVPNRARILCTSNQIDGCNAKHEGRRLFLMICTDYWKIHRTDLVKNLEEIFGGKQQTFGLNDFNTKAISCLYAWFMKFDLDKFDTTAIPETLYLSAQKDANQHPVWRFVRTLMTTRYIVNKRPPSESKPPVDEVEVPALGWYKVTILELYTAYRYWTNQNGETSKDNTEKFWKALRDNIGAPGKVIQGFIVFDGQNNRGLEQYVLCTSPLKKYFEDRKRKRGESPDP